MITSSHLPFSGIEVELIDKENLTPFFSELLFNEYQFYIHKDGSLVSIFELPEIEIPYINTIIDNLIPGASIQIYKIKQQLEIKNYLVIKLPIDTNYLNLSLKSTISRILKGTDDLVSHMNDMTIKTANSTIELVGSKPKNVAVSCNSLYSYLMECSSSESGFPTPSVTIKSNMSVILTGKDRCTSLFSLNDYRNLNNSTRDLLSGFDSYLQYLSIHRPSKPQGLKIEDTVFNSTSLISCLSPVESEAPRVHTIGIEDSQYHLSDLKKGLYFISSAFVFNADSVADLDSTTKTFQQSLLRANVMPYFHTNSSALHYQSCFPGNSNSGYHYQLAYSSFTHQLIHRYFDL